MVKGHDAPHVPWPGGAWTGLPTDIGTEGGSVGSAPGSLDTQLLDLKQYLQALARSSLVLEDFLLHPMSAGQAI